MYDLTPLVKMGWDDYADATKAERTITSEYSVIKLFANMLPKGGNILDVGCGSGKPITDFFVKEGFKVQGIDISPKQIQKAKSIFPSCSFSVSDMLTYGYPENHYDAVICLHSLEHIERIHHGKVLKKIYQTLKPGGMVLISLNTYSREEVSFLTPQIQMFYSHFDQFESIKNITGADLSIINSTNVHISGKNYLYVIAKKGDYPKTDQTLVYSASN